MKGTPDAERFMLNAERRNPYFGFPAIIYNVRISEDSVQPSALSLRPRAFRLQK